VIDGALWSAVRVLEEHAELKMRTANRASAGGLTAVEEGFAQSAREAHEQAQSIRMLRFPNPEMTAGGPSPARPRRSSGARTARTTAAEQRRAAHEHAVLASRLIAIQDDERQRIARDLHDNVGQHVTALRLKLSQVEASAVEALRPRIREIDALVEQLDHQLDFLARHLRPAVLDLGVAAAIAQFAHEWSETFGIPTEVQASDMGDVDLPASAATHFYRVAQEALNNVYKHAGATRVNVILERVGHALLLIVEDNGKGFDVSTHVATSTSGMGLPGMRERAQILGGSLNVESLPEKGTTVYFRASIAADTAV
jgi:signal transduction histidine kinase